jgi:hypothetical protein
VALLLGVGLGSGWRDDHLVGSRPARSLGQRDERAAVALHRLGADARVSWRGHADKFVERHVVGAGQGQEHFQGRLAAAGFQPRQRAHRDAGCRRQGGERRAALPAQRPQPRTDRAEHGVIVHEPIAASANRFVK